MLQPDWQVDSSVQALQSTRLGGCSEAPFDSFNLGFHVGDKTSNVEANHQRLLSHLPNPAFWLDQVHGAEVVHVEQSIKTHTVSERPQADALYTRLANQPLAIMTADCLPVLLASKNGKEVAAIHGGWRSLSLGIITKTINHFHTEPEDICVWLGPAIGPKAFEVGAEVKELFCSFNQAHEADFTSHQNGKFLADIYGIATRQLQGLGVQQIFGAQYCTFSDSEQFYSYRRDGQTGRMATLIWRK